MNIVQTYEEQNDFTNSAGPIYPGQNGLWQFSLIISSPAMQGNTFCFRAATSSGTVLTAVNIPELSYAASTAPSTPTMDQLLRGRNWWGSDGVRKNKML
jgi:hypothetical protein